MPYLIARGERFALQPGDNVLGGSGDQAVLLPGLASLVPAAVLTLAADGRAATLRALPPAGVGITVDGAPLGDAPLPVRHGSRVLLGVHELVYGDLAAVGGTAHVVGLQAAPPPAANSLASANPTADTGGRLVALRGGRLYPVPEQGLVIGRDPACDVALDAKDVSRRHAVVRASLFGYAVTSEGANGTFVNGERVDSTHVLGQGDVLRVGPEEFRFEADAASYEPSPALLEAAARFVPDPLPPPTAPAGAPAEPSPAVPEAAGAPTAPAPLAMLEVVNEGPARGTRYPVERAVTQIGRAPQSDIRFTDGSVSGAHATILLRRGAWYVVDLDATNGTYVNGERVAGERALTPGCTVRFGDVKLQFWSLAANAADLAGSTRAVVGVVNGRRAGAG